MSHENSTDETNMSSDISEDIDFENEFSDESEQSSSNSSLITNCGAMECNSPFCPICHNNGL